ITENYLPDPRRDPNCVFPIDALRTLEAEGFIGGLADDLFSCMGGIYSQRRVHAELIPALSEAFRKQKVDAVLLVPMCPVCHQTATLIARHLEAQGTPTMVMASALDIVKAGRAPRISFVDHPLGHTVGKVFDRAGQLDIVRRGLAGLEAMNQPEQVAVMPSRWAETDDWKAEEWRKGGAGGKDERKPRDGTPQYQTEQDRILAEGR
ncbi:MAG: glycine/sarcosine/betaine reductase selenoprotein B family protein, partial [Alphaproteobacteria bacterium]